MTKKRKRSKWPLILLISFLAILCVGAVELAVCRVADPALYETLTGPARAWLHRTGNAAARQIDALSSGVEELVEGLKSTPEPEAPPESQLAGEPALASEESRYVPSVTRLDERKDGQWLTGGSSEIRYFCQTDPEWADKPYGRDRIGGYGCGPTAMAMAVTSLTGEAVDPAGMAAWAYRNGHWSKGNGSRLSIINGVGVAYGLEVTSLIEPTADDLLQALSTGQVAVALMTKGHFTKGGHFILLRGATLSGQVLVADPVSLERSLTTWDPQLILDELSQSRTNGAPLWLLAPAKAAVE